ncbi:hypothetical protein N499_0215B, partial [Wolbachia pipientis wVitA]
QCEKLNMRRQIP